MITNVSLRCRAPVTSLIGRSPSVVLWAMTAKRARKQAAADSSGAAVSNALEQTKTATSPSPSKSKKARAMEEITNHGEIAGTTKPKAKRGPRKPKEPPPPPPPSYDLDMRKPKLSASPRTPTILCWNVAGLRGLLNKDSTAISKLAESESAQILCLQEVKLQTSHIDEELHKLLGLDSSWHAFWNCSTEKKGYSGTAILTQIKPISVVNGIGIAEHDGEGRVVAAEFENFYLVDVYVPNSGEGLRRLDYRVGSNGWDESFSAFIKQLEKKKPVVVCGDMNCARHPIDIHSPKTNLRSAGFTQEERDSFQKVYMDGGLVDAFRARFPEHTGYTYWSRRFPHLRTQNRGWRLDYFLVSQAFWPKVYDIFHRYDVPASDHCPLGLTLSLDSSQEE